MHSLAIIVLSALACVAFGQYRSQNELDQYPRNYHPPAPVHYVNIGAQLAGDYKFGYDTGKGPLGQSFREETRLPDGTVQGAYGIFDETGKQRIIRYTAGKDGFKAEGDGIAPPAPAVAPNPAYQPPEYRAAPVQQYQPPPQQYNPPAAPRYNPAPAPQYNPAPAPQYNPPAAPVQQYRPQQAARSTGTWDPRKDDPYYQDGPSFIDVERLSYNIGTSG